MIGQAPGSSWAIRQMYQTQEKRQIRRDSNFIGAGMLALTIFMQLTFTGVLLLMALFGIVSPAALAGQEGANFGLSENAYLVTYMLVYTIAMGFPMPLVALVCRRNINPFGPRQRVRPGVFFCLVFLGMAICILANFITSYIMTYLEYFGVPQPEMPDLMKPDAIGLVLNILIFCVLPAFLEEMVFRGYVLQALRPHGDGVALLVSALLTAIYMFQIAVRAWFPRHSAPAIPEGSVHEAGWQMLVPMVVLAAACLLMGLMPQGLLDLIREAVTL